ncbi:MAG: nucleoside-diphosphate kinase [Lentisphaerae bacterium]|nr:nucleoside-diphosphate kinase [Lentisphaerota bacterium]
MAKELAFVMINPYTIAKSRTGGVIARYVARTDLRLASARMFGPSAELVREYAALVRRNLHTRGSEHENLVPDYILKAYAPDPATGRPRRVMLLLFEGEDAVDKIWSVTGSATLKSGSGETVRDTYGDYVLDEQNRVCYFEPAVLAGPTREQVASTLRLWARFSARDGGMIASAGDVDRGDRTEQTLVLIKPDNFRFPSGRAGNIIDLLSVSGLRIVAVKKVRMTIAQAEDFYAPVRQSLRNKFAQRCGGRVSEALQREFGFRVPDDAVRAACEQIAPAFADDQFEKIVEFMTGYRPSSCTPDERRFVGREECLALVYAGPDAVAKIRAIVGQTDPRQARPGSVRREFGRDVMVNAAHASDSPDNARREMEIIRVAEDRIPEWVTMYYGGVMSRLRVMSMHLPGARREFVRRIKARWSPVKEPAEA